MQIGSASTVGSGSKTATTCCTGSGKLSSSNRVHQTGRVDLGGRPPKPPLIRACTLNAPGSSAYVAQGQT
jgi:hypothetical protein